MSRFVTIAVFICLLNWRVDAANQDYPRNVIFETDMGPDYDDVGALALLHALADRGEVNILATISSKDKMNEKFDLYILAGQSNMAGRGKITDSLKALHDERVWMLTKDFSWVIAGHPVHFDKPAMAGVGPGLSFGIEMANAHPGVKIGLIPCAVGGTSIDKWQPGAFDKVTSTFPYDDAVVRIKEAMKKGHVKGMIWLQGEADSSPDKASKYLHKLELLVKRIRKLTNDKNLPIVVGELGCYRTKYQLVNTELHKGKKQIENFEVAGSEGLRHKGDNTHFNSESAVVFGKRFAKKMLELQNTSSK
jgi:hypothetical protein